MRQPTAQRILGLGGVVAPFLFTALVAVASLLRPGYSQIADFVSDLGVGTYAGLQNANFAVFGLLVVGLAAGLFLSLPPPRGIAFAVGVGLTVVFGLGVLLAGVFPEDYAGGGMHSNVSSLAFIASILAALVVGLGLRNADAEAWGRYRAFCLVSGVLGLVLLVVFGLSAGSAFRGAAQRAFIAVPWLWVGGTGLQVHARARIEDGAGASAL